MTKKGLAHRASLFNRRLLRWQKTSGESKTADNVAKISEHEKPAQRRLEDEIGKLKTQFHSLVTLRETGLSSVDKKQIDEVKSAISDKELKLKRLKSEAERQRKRRQKLKEGIGTVTKNNTEAAALLKSFNRKVTGRPRVEVDQTELLSAIVQLVEGSSAAHDRRRCEVLRTVTTLADMVGELRKLGFTLSRSTLYLRLLPRRGTHRRANDMRKLSLWNCWDPTIIYGSVTRTECTPSLSSMTCLRSQSCLDRIQFYLYQMMTKQGCH